LIAWLVSFLYNAIAGKIGWKVIPTLTRASFKKIAIIKQDVFWYVAAGVEFVIGVKDMLLSAGTPIQYDLTKPTYSVRPQAIKDDTPRDDQDHWDVFISYKSEDIYLACRIANQLLASGLQVCSTNIVCCCKTLTNFKRQSIMVLPIQIGPL